VNHSELVDLIREGVPGPGGFWAELGAGSGAFTAALADMLGPGARIVAVDKDAGALRELQARLGNRDDLSLDTVHADFRQPLGLNDLDGVHERILLTTSGRLATLWSASRLTESSRPEAKLLGTVRLSGGWCVLRQGEWSTRATRGRVGGRCGLLLGDGNIAQVLPI